MADYYSPTVVDPMIPLAAMLPIERLFLSQVFDEELTSETAYYCSEDGGFEDLARRVPNIEPIRAAIAITSREYRLSSIPGVPWVTPSHMAGTPPATWAVAPSRRASALIRSG